MARNESQPFEMGVSRRLAAGDQYMDSISNSTPETNSPGTAEGALASMAENPLDGDVARKEHKQLLEWYYLERQKQAENRLQMSIDADFYDNEQWDPQDAADVRSRGQVPLNYNEVAPMCDWLIGTERRTRVDWSVLPRCEDDVQSADVKKKVLKFISDVNRIPFVRSRSFADAIKVGVGWVDDGARDDPTQDILYSKYEDWRNVIWDSAGYELDLTDARFLFRWRWTDLDVAEMMFPTRVNQIRRASIDSGAIDHQENLADDWYLGEPLAGVTSGTMYATGAGVLADARRKRIRLIEAQYRKPVKVKIVSDGPFKGAVIHPADQVLQQHVQGHGSEIVDRVMMRTHIAVFTETDMLSMAESIYRHNRFTLTPIWCYRRGKDRLPYGAIRRVRDIQQDINKRASKALFLLNTNQIIADKNAVDDKDIARAEADQPDGYIEKNPGKEFILRRDTEAATGQIQMMTLGAQKIQNSAGINNENMGRQSNAISGEAIKARQLQGSVGTTEPFDNLRLAVQIQGEKQLSLSEQFYTEEKVIRLSGAKGSLEWVKINQPERQPDGSVRYINDITANIADFVVSEQDYAGTLRQVMLDSITQMASNPRIDPTTAMRMFIIAMEFSDLPNKDEIAGAFRKAIGERDPNKPMSPEDAQQAQQQAQMQAEALQNQREMASLALQEKQAEVAKLNAEAQRIQGEAAGQGGIPPEYQQNIQKIQAQAQNEIDKLSEALRKAQSTAATDTMRINKEQDTRMEVARIEAANRLEIAELNAGATGQIAGLEARLAEIAKAMEQLRGPDSAATAP